MGKQCQNCGRIVEASALFCAGCGHPVAQKENEISEQIPEEMQEQFAGFAKGHSKELVKVFINNFVQPLQRSVQIAKKKSS